MDTNDIRGIVSFMGLDEEFEVWASTHKAAISLAAMAVDFVLEKDTYPIFQEYVNKDSNGEKLDAVPEDMEHIQRHMWSMVRILDQLLPYGASYE